MYVMRVQHNWRRQAGFCIDEPVYLYYNLFHFPDPIQIRVGEEVFLTKPDACIFSAPKQPRWFYFPNKGAVNWMHNFVEIEPLLKKYNIPINTVFYPSNPSFISDLFRKIYQEFNGSDVFREELVDGYVEELLIKLSRALQSNIPYIPLSTEDQKKLRALRQQIRNQPEYHWTVGELAEKANLSPSRFHAVYKSMFGVSPVADVIEAKIDRAKAVLLLNSEASVQTVAEQLGYSNTYHFIRQFKAVTGITPGAFRKITP